VGKTKSGRVNGEEAKVTVRERTKTTKEESLMNDYIASIVCYKNDSNSDPRC